MPGHLLDSVVIADFQQGKVLPALVSASRRVPLSLAEHVYDEMTIPRPNARPEAIHRAREAKRELDSGAFETLQIFSGSPAHALFMRLTFGTAREHDNGEAASIAVAAQRPDLVFVTGDKNGTFSALNELFGPGERVMRVPVFVRWLFERGALEARDVRKVAAYAGNHGLKPSWWLDWLSRLPADGFD